MDDPEEIIYHPADGEPFPATEFLNTDNIQETGIDWFQQNGVYKRYMGLSYLPNNTPVSDLRALVHAEEVEEYKTQFSSLGDEVGTDHTSSLAAKKSNLVNLLENSKIYRIARNKIISTQSDETTRRIQNPTVNTTLLFRIEAVTKNHLESHTENIIKISKEIGAEVSPVEASPKFVKSAMAPIGIRVEDIGDQFCISVDAATYASLQMLQEPRELIEELYDEDPDNHHYVFGYDELLDVVEPNGKNDTESNGQN